MILSVELPDQIARQLHLDETQHSHRALEMLALEGYRSGDLARGQVGQLLDMNFHETENFLKENNVYTELTMEEFERS